MNQSRIQLVKQKYLSWNGMNNIIHHLWQQNVKSWGLFHCRQSINVENGSKNLIVNVLLDGGSMQT